MKTKLGKDIKNEQINPFTSHHKFLIVGGGTAGITVAAQLKREIKRTDIAIIGPADVHYYQPMWTFNGAGVLNKERSKKLMKDVIPKGVSWIQDRVEIFEPEKNLVKTKTGAAVRKQSKVVTGNLVSLEKRGEINQELSYDGYGSCPLITGFGKLILAEFDYDNKITPSFPINQMKERRSMYYMKKDILPLMYWYGMLKGFA